MLKTVVFLSLVFFFGSTLAKSPEEIIGGTVPVAQGTCVVKGGKLIPPAKQKKTDKELVCVASVSQLGQGFLTIFGNDEVLYIFTLTGKTPKLVWQKGKPI